jgi:ABC-type transporter Mla MlaB component
VSTAEAGERLLLQFRLDSGVAVVKVTGEVDVATFGVLAGVWRRVRATDGSLALAMPSRQVQAILDATGLTKVLSICGLEEEAVQACARPGLRAS